MSDTRRTYKKMAGFSSDEGYPAVRQWMAQGEVRPFAEQSPEAQEALRVWLSEYKDAANDYGIDPQQLVGTARVPMDQFKMALLQRIYDYDGEEHPDFDAYHRAFLERNPDLPSYGNSRWPVITDPYLVIDDGFHRFHDYYRQGDQDVPIIYFPPDRFRRMDPMPPFESSSTFQYLHASDRDYQPGDRLLPASQTGHKSEFASTPWYDPNYVYLRDHRGDPTAFENYGSNVYLVEPEGEVTQDPEHDPTRYERPEDDPAYYSWRAPAAKVVRRITPEDEKRFWYSSFTPDEPTAEPTVPQGSEPTTYPPDELWSLSDIRNQYSLSPSQLSNYFKRFPDFPQPVQDPRLYHRPAVEQWFADRAANPPRRAFPPGFQRYKKPHGYIHNFDAGEDAPFPREELWTPTEIAKAMGVSQSALSNYISRSYLNFPAPVHTVGTRRFYHRPAVENWFANRRSSSTEEVLAAIFASPLPALPPQEQRLGACQVSWWEMDPGEVYIHAEGGTTNDRHYARTVVALGLEPHGYKRAQFDLDGGDSLADRVTEPIPGPDTGIRAGYPVVGEHLGQMSTSRDTGHLGTGIYFASGRNAIAPNGVALAGRDDSWHGVDLRGLNLYRPKNHAEAVRTYDALARINYHAHSNHPIPEHGLHSIDGIAYGLPFVSGVGGFEGNKPIIERAIQSTRDDLADIPFYQQSSRAQPLNTASTRVMQGLGFHGVDTRHIPDLDNTWMGSVVYRPDERFDRSRTSAQRVASWVDIMAKAKRLIQSSQVQLLANDFNNIVAHVVGDHGDYDVEIGRDDPNSRAITSWTCTCPWDQYAWQRTRKWKKFEGRPCAHVLATYWKSLSTPLDGQLSEQQAMGLGTGQKLGPAAPRPAPEHQLDLPRSFGPEGPIQGDQLQMAHPPPDALGGPPGPAQAPLSPPPMGPEPSGVIPPFPGAEVEQQWAGPGTTPGGGVSPPGAVSVPGAKPQTFMDPIQNANTLSKVAANYPDSRWQQGLCGTYAIALQQANPALKIGMAGLPPDEPEFGLSPDHFFAHDDTHAYDSLGKHSLPYRGLAGQWDNVLNINAGHWGIPEDEVGPEGTEPALAAAHAHIARTHGFGKASAYEDDWTTTDTVLPSLSDIDQSRYREAYDEIARALDNTRRGCGLDYELRALPSAFTNIGLPPDEIEQLMALFVRKAQAIIHGSKISAEFQPPQVVRLKKPMYGIARGPVPGQYGDGAYREVPAGSLGEVYDVHPDGSVGVRVPLDDSGEHEPYHVESWVEPSDIEPTNQSNAFIRRHTKMAQTDDNLRQFMDNLAEVPGMKYIVPTPNEELTYQPGDRVTRQYANPAPRSTYGLPGEGTICPNTGTVVKVREPGRHVVDQDVKYDMGLGPGGGREVIHDLPSYDVQWDLGASPGFTSYHEPGAIGEAIAQHELWPEGHENVYNSLVSPQAPDALPEHWPEQY